MIVGAGTSVGAGLPLAVGLKDLVTDRLEKDSDTGVGPRIASVLKKAAQLFSSLKNTDDQRARNPDLEFLIDRLWSVANLPNEALGDEWVNIPTFDMATLTSFVSKHVVEILYDGSDASYLANVGELLSLQNPLPIFSLNHDVCLETALAAAGIPCALGFDTDGQWNPSTFSELTSGVLLYKLHGSVDWMRGDFLSYPFRRGGKDEVLERLKEPCYEEAFGFLPDQVMKEYDTPIIHFGGRMKFIMEYPFLQFMEVLDHSLRSTSVITLLGYSMFDRHVGHLINQSFHYGKKTVIHVDPYAPLKDQRQEFIAPVMATKGARASHWEGAKMVALLYDRLRFRSLQGRAEDPKTWKELAEVIRT